MPDPETNEYPSTAFNGPATVQVRDLIDQQDVESVANLWRITRDALAMRPPLYVSSILGMPWTWLPPHHRYSEFRIIDPWRLGRTLKFLINTTVPSLPRTPPPFGPPFLNQFFWQPSVILQRPDQNGNYTTFPDEAWFFVNGIMTNDAVAQINAAYLAHLFHRPVTLIQNSTDSLLIDLLQCAAGKQWRRNTEPAITAFPVLYDALRSPHKRKVVLIAHSQGTIIASNLLRMLARVYQVPEAPPRFAPPEFVFPDQADINFDDFEPLGPAELAKLEVYCFATCANQLKYVGWSEELDRSTPWIEHFGNEKDLVCRLGMLAPDPAAWGIDIDGPRYARTGFWGHLLNAHYLVGIEESQKDGRKRGSRGGSGPFRLLDAATYPSGTSPRLFDYINGGSPADL